MDKKKVNRINRVPGITYREGVHLKTEPRETSQSKVRSPIHPSLSAQVNNLTQATIAQTRPLSNQKVKGINSLINQQLQQSNLRAANPLSSRNASSSLNRNSSSSKERTKFRSSKYEKDNLVMPDKKMSSLAQKNANEGPYKQIYEKKEPIQLYDYKESQVEYYGLEEEQQQYHSQQTQQQDEENYQEFDQQGFQDQQQFQEIPSKEEFERYETRILEEQQNERVIIQGYQDESYSQSYQQQQDFHLQNSDKNVQPTQSIPQGKRSSHNKFNFSSRSTSRSNPQKLKIPKLSKLQQKKKPVLDHGPEPLSNESAPLEVFTQKRNSEQIKKDYEKLKEQVAEKLKFNRSRTLSKNRDSRQVSDTEEVIQMVKKNIQNVEILDGGLEQTVRNESKVEGEVLKEEIFSYPVQDEILGSEEDSQDEIAKYEEKISLEKVHDIQETKQDLKEDDLEDMEEINQDISEAELLDQLENDLSSEEVQFGIEVVQEEAENKIEVQVEEKVPSEYEIDLKQAEDIEESSSDDQEIEIPVSEPESLPINQIEIDVFSESPLKPLTPLITQIETSELYFSEPEVKISSESRLRLQKIIVSESEDSPSPSASEFYKSNRKSIPVTDKDLETSKEMNVLAETFDIEKLRTEVYNISGNSPAKLQIQNQKDTIPLIKIKVKKEKKGMKKAANPVSKSQPVEKKLIQKTHEKSKPIKTTTAPSNVTVSKKEVQIKMKKTESPSKAITRHEPPIKPQEANLVVLKAPELAQSYDIDALHAQYKKIISDMQKSYEAEFESLKSFILKQNNRNKQSLKNCQKTHEQQIREKDREVKTTKVENSQLKDIVRNKDIDIKELKEEILSIDKQLKQFGGGRHSTRLEVPSPQKTNKSKRLRELAELSSSVIFKSMNDQSRREKNIESSVRASQTQKSIDRHLERSWKKYKQEKERQDSLENERSHSKNQNNFSGSMGGLKKEEMRFENREGLHNWEQNWRSSLRSETQEKKKSEGVKDASNEKLQKSAHVQAKIIEKVKQLVKSVSESGSSAVGTASPDIDVPKEVYSENEEEQEINHDSIIKVQEMIQNVEIKSQHISKKHLTPKISEKSLKEAEKEPSAKSSSNESKEETPLHVKPEPISSTIDKVHEKIHQLNKNPSKKQDTKEVSPIRSPSQRSARDSSAFENKPIAQHVAYITNFYKSHISNPHNPLKSSSTKQDMNLEKTPEIKPYSFSKTDFLPFEQISGVPFIETKNASTNMIKFNHFYKLKSYQLVSKGILQASSLKMKSPILSSLQKESLIVNFHDPSQFSIQYPDDSIRSVVLEMNFETKIENVYSVCKFYNGDVEYYMLDDESKLIRVYFYSKFNVTEIVYFEEEKTRYIFEQDGQVETIHSNGLIEICAVDRITKFQPDNTSFTIFASGVEETIFADGSRAIVVGDKKIEVNEYGKVKQPANVIQTDAKDSEDELTEPQETVKTETEPEDYDPNASEQELDEDALGYPTEDDFDPNAEDDLEVVQELDESEADDNGKGKVESEGVEEVEYEEEEVEVTESEPETVEVKTVVIKKEESEEEGEAEEEVEYEEVEVTDTDQDPEADGEEEEYEEVEVTDDDAQN